MSTEPRRQGFRAIFSQTHLVTLVQTGKINTDIEARIALLNTA
jgi:hypothetical protein